MQQSEMPFARLIFPDGDPLMLDPCLDGAEAVIARVSHPVVPHRLASKAAVLGRSMGVRFRPEPHGLYGPSMHVEILCRHPDASLLAPGGPAQALLAEVVGTVMEMTRCDLVEWESAGNLLSARDFATWCASEGIASTGPAAALGDGTIETRAHPGLVRRMVSGLRTLGGFGRRLVAALSRGRAPLVATAPVIALTVALSMSSNAQDITALLFP
ncbi:hypothetical protein [Cognatishimia sp. F0-27]|uniref:hypothetical protein n=1 Tax=Cognatishimia sp. F0-27 TaxID=2816855 RepID=UPI001D0C415D|nr:hypothetical protein [Cognatishimia sp. F0-27]MCC1493399.1 hypothetical protein [Cognatishimia sp. F0-27]